MAAGGSLTDERQRTVRLAALFLLGCAWFNAPLLRVVSRPDTIFGLPLPWLYLFASWALFILLAALIGAPSRGDREERLPPPPGGGEG